MCGPQSPSPIITADLLGFSECEASRRHIQTCDKRNLTDNSHDPDPCTSRLLYHYINCYGTHFSSETTT
ncbi:hypothetical protein ScPMuIL_002735 [Solemya velum]